MKSMKHILTLALALLVLALPLGALADDQGLSFSLSNISVKTEGLASNIDTTIDAGIELNVLTPEDMSYFDAVLNVLAGGEKALSAGVTYDQETAAVTMALAGATDALSMKVTDAVQQTPMAQLPVDTEAIAAAFASLNDLTLSEDAQNALSNAVMGWMVQHIPSEPTGSEDVEITDMMDDTAVATLTMDAYDFEMTVGDIVDLLTDAGDALKTDPAFIAGIQSFIDQIMAAVGQPSFDITQAGEQLPEDVLATTISGTVYTSEGGTVIDLVIGDNLGCFIDVVNMEDGTLFVQNAIIAPDGTTANTRAILNGATM